MGQRKHRNIVIRGITYPTAQHAARALGVSDTTVMLAVRRGKLDTCGTGASHPKPMPVHVGGRDFPTARAAAEHFGVTPGAIYKAIDDGEPERIGQPQEYNGHRSRAFSIGGQTWPSMSAASRALGFGHGYIAQAIRKNRHSSMQKVLSAAMRLNAQRENAARDRNMIPTEQKPSSASQQGN